MPSRSPSLSLAPSPAARRPARAPGTRAPFGLIFIAAAIVSAALHARPALAYCRTTTTCDECFEDAVESCPTPGHPLYWARSCVSFSVQKDGSKLADYDLVEKLATEAFSSWQLASCSGGAGHPSIAVADAFGPAVCHRQEYNVGQGNANIIMLYDSGFPFPENPDALALTTVMFNSDTGEIYDADMQIDMSKSISVSDSIPLGSYDLLSILTHESGHFLGISHSGVADSVMRPTYMQGANLRVLGATDVDAICAIYPPGKPMDACDFTPRHGFSPDCLMATSYAGGCALAEGGARRAAGSRSDGRQARALAAGLFALLALRARRRSTRGARRNGDPT